MVSALYPQILLDCFELAPMNVTSRVRVAIVNQLVQLIAPGEGLQQIVAPALQQVFFASNSPTFCKLSGAFREKCVHLLASGLKNSVLRSVVVDLVNVLVGGVQESVFERKYCQI